MARNALPRQRAIYFIAERINIDSMIRNYVYCLPTDGVNVGTVGLKGNNAGYRRGW